MKTYYMASYDIESERCLKGVQSIVKQHIKYNAPATFFVLGELLENKDMAKELKLCIDNDLFDIESHTYSHIMFKDSNGAAEGVDLAVINEEVRKTSQLINSVFNREVIGLRSPCGFENGLLGEKELQHILWYNGIRFVSSKLMGKGNTVPAPISSPFYYEKDDVLRPLLELPTHDWHDNILKGYNFCPVGWPPNLPWGYPSWPPKTPEEEFAVYKKGLDYCYENQMIYYAPVMHPWSIYKFNKNADTVGLILNYLKKRDIPVCSYKQMYRMISDETIQLVQ